MFDDDVDSDDFLEAMKGVKPLRSQKVHPDAQKKVNAIPKSTLALRRQEAQRPYSNSGAALSEAWIQAIEPEEFISFRRDGIQEQKMRQLKAGQLDIQGELDLHGYKVEEAREEINDFIHAAYVRGITCVRIIHGKSHRTQDRQSTLKSHTNHWLRQLPRVLAFTSAPPAEGGTGSLLVLLKRNGER